MCPLRVAALEADWVNIDNMGPGVYDNSDLTECLGERCAWWDAEAGRCMVWSIGWALCQQVPT